ncbi:hypothetical protein BO70DRAFT_378613 [Aspergillus heteromorphus CBS 117.55]|uniref:endo-1,3(4)-beta-glucanase n=1 Tax=Aspergillus heteromorphus CBS 117.55 TaxID=1448321 RepID=A0A317WL24_9EURO|nr:uncharacterized protein BO70DRAFT_378613 [Aspergillus heteromorphus CBS 117.55]PWY87009.1 hypothetical protein BO70DRAFT_378613 [Aspergillus heteromorphus CBS 117.55]
MRSTTLSLLSALGLTAQLSAATYSLEEDYATSNFFEKFTFYTEADPTAGFVDYVSESTAKTDGLISENSSSVYMGVDYTNVASSSGRKSVRITSNSAYTHGLFILDLEHMPGGICGTWPAFWLLGSDWPYNGEIDIIEGVNLQTTNDMTLHTSENCTISADSGFTGTLSTDNCYIYAADQSSNAGCGIDATNTDTYGTGFNANGGGVYATEWTSEAISIYFFARGSIPSDITDGSPKPASWGTPLAKYKGSCDIDEHFSGMQIIFDTTFCGDWAGAVWSTSTCASKASTCTDYVQNNPSAFKEAYWTVNSLKVYKSDTDATSDAKASATTKKETNTTVTSTKVVHSTATATATEKVQGHQHRRAHGHGRE